MHILGIETSCDETSVSVVRDGTAVLSCVVASSKDAFHKSGGVIPEDAAREQIRCMIPVLDQALTESSMTLKNIDVIAVTAYPGLLGSLLVGTTTARMLAWIHDKPLIPVHHTLGHLDSVWLDTDTDDPPQFPCLTLSVSGGHSDLWLRTSHTYGTLISTTRDDAAGEAFDKGALLLGLPYPGGPALAKLADSGNSSAYKFPHPLPGSTDFSFSGLKTALKYLLRDMQADEIDHKKTDVAASYQEAICAHLADRVVQAVKKYPQCKEVHVVGGVSANQRLRSMLRSSVADDISIRTPKKLLYCTDNAAMIAGAAYFLQKENPSAVNAEFRTAPTKSMK